ncbi:MULTISPECIES: hypothetical protein [unclassified Agromyces]|uniref:hypothetical protein n=1 Tax=unclassified Agromyces TaxID=2639701 RepID=UPI00301420CD
MADGKAGRAGDSDGADHRDDGGDDRRRRQDDEPSGANHEPVSGAYATNPNDTGMRLVIAKSAIPPAARRAETISAVSRAGRIRCMAPHYRARARRNRVRQGIVRASLADRLSGGADLICERLPS